MFRALGDGDDRDEQELQSAPTLEEWLAEVAMRREVAIMQLRHYDMILVRHGRLRSYTLPSRRRD